MIFFTVNDLPSGVYKSQVVDVVRELSEISGKPVKLVAMLPFRGYFAQRKKLKKMCPSVSVWPMVPGLANWKMNRKVVAFVGGFRNAPIIARGPMAFWIASKYSAKVCYDGRGAVKAELEEFPTMIGNREIEASLIAAEELAVTKSSFRIAVSEALVSYWRKEFGYKGSAHVVIPCCISVETPSPNPMKISRGDFGWLDEHIVLVYSGGDAGWQSFQRMIEIAEDALRNDKVRMLFLCPTNEIIAKLKKQHGDKIFQKWVSPTEVFAHLTMADYGLLVRSHNITNSVASPVKFGEYLAAGLKVLISPSLGDYSQLVARENLGVVLNDKAEFLPTRVPESERNKLKNFAKSHLTKSNFRDNYRKVIENLSK